MRTKTFLSTYAAAAALASVFFAPQVAGALSEQHDQQPDTVPLVTHANNAANSYKHGDFAAAEKISSGALAKDPRPSISMKGCTTPRMHTGEVEDRWRSHWKKCFNSIIVQSRVFLPIWTGVVSSESIQ